MIESMFIDYAKSDQCENEECMYFTCYKCGKCGRKFENGFMVDDGGTTVTDEYDD